MSRAHLVLRAEKVTRGFLGRKDRKEQWETRVLPGLPALRELKGIKAFQGRRGLKGHRETKARLGHKDSKERREEGRRQPAATVGGRLIRPLVQTAGGFDAAKETRAHKARKEKQELRGTKDLKERREELGRPGHKALRAPQVQPRRRTFMS